MFLSYHSYRTLRAHQWPFLFCLKPEMFACVISLHWWREERTMCCQLWMKKAERDDQYVECKHSFKMIMGKWKIHWTVSANAHAVEYETVFLWQAPYKYHYHSSIPIIMCFQVNIYKSIRPVSWSKSVFRPQSFPCPTSSMRRTVLNTSH